MQQHAGRFFSYAPIFRRKIALRRQVYPRI
jgi:hypothetical protein